jgi:hypothetical protein
MLSSLCHVLWHASSMLPCGACMFPLLCPCVHRLQQLELLLACMVFGCFVVHIGSLAGYGRPDLTLTSWPSQG